jgi:hypothetical protein
MIIRALLVVMVVVVFDRMATAQQWQAQKAPLMTRWAKEVSPERVHPEYPRPQLARQQWQNLNGLWNYAIQGKDEKQPSSWQGEILVPFPVESALSGVMKMVGPANRLWYQRTFDVPAAWQGQRVLLHFGAVDWDATVLVNGKEVGRHVGGYDPFSFDITEAIKQGKNEIVLSVWDPTSDGFQPIGKQHLKPHGIWYTPTTGIWQTVWIEPVPQVYVGRLKITPDLDNNQVHIATTLTNGSERPDGNVFAFTVLDGDKEVARSVGPSGNVILQIKDAKAWSPDSPHLYTLRVTASDGKSKDELESYFGLRKVSVGKDEKGITRLMLNNKFVFQYGPLDQGFWPDGLYTAPTDEALRFDIEITKKFGMNMARKHVKVEPQRWYYWCDKLGLLVWQDMPSGEKHVRPNGGEITRTKESAENFERELKEMMDDFHNHPSIVMWVPFNEGWGQYDTVRITEWVKKQDPSRLVICASGWNDYPAGDAHDIHAYPGPGSPKPEEKRAAVLGEFGGLGLPLEAHTWQAKGNWGYRSFTTKEALTEAYLNLIQRLRPLIGEPGLSAAVYTQTTDVEIEVNGLMTYDREVIKIDPGVLVAAHKKLYLPPPVLTTVLATSQQTPQEWQYTTEKPASDDWTKPEFDASSWKKGPAGFGEKDTPGAVVRTDWTTNDIWIRRTFELKDVNFTEPQLLIHHDEDAEVYINGVLAAKTQNYTSDYVTVPISKEARAALKAGVNTIAIHCRQTIGGQYIDAGIIDYRQAQ